MRILALETSGQVGSAALLDAADTTLLLAEATTAANERTAKSMAPLVKALLHQAQWSPDSIELVAVTVGPGSFTGLRIGVTMAKTFAYAVGAQVLGVNTLEVLANQGASVAAPIWTIMDAQRQELFTAKFIAADDSRRLKAVDETQIMTQAAWLEALRPGDHITGPGLRRLAAPLPADVTVAPQSFWQPTAATLGQIAWRDHQSGRRDDLWKLVPIYYRPSAAEEKAAQHFR